MRTPWLTTTAVRRARQRPQRGISLLSMAMVIGIVAMLMVGATRDRIRESTSQAGAVMGSGVALVAQAVEQYRTQNMGTLTMATPTIPDFANPMAPTTAELKAAGYLNVNVADTVGDAGTYTIALQKTPVGCVGPSATCNVWSRIHLSNPIVDPNGLPNVTRLTALIARVQQSTSYSRAPTPASITGGGGAWTIPNPDPGGRPGILVIVAGLGGATEPWLRVQDPRNPDFRGPVTAIQFDTIHKVIGSACTPQGAFASAVDGLAYCNAGVWVIYNGQVAAAGAACTIDGAMGHSAAGASLLCIDAIWRDHLTYGFRSIGYFAHNTVVPRPSCGPGLYAQAVVSGVSASVIIGGNNAGNNTGSWQAEIDPVTWLVRIVGSDTSQAGTNARALVTTVCAVT